MDESSKLLLTVAIPTITVLIGILVNSRQLDSFRNEIKAELAAVRVEMIYIEVEMNARFEAAHQALLRVESVMDARLKRLEDRAG